VQALYANNAGTRIVPVTPQATNGLYTSGSLDERSHELIVKAINTTGAAMPVEIHLGGQITSGAAKVISLESADLNGENSFDHPKAISPQASTAEVKSGTISAELQPYSVNVYRIPKR
jgi:alpha-N-arabinofuranosidase